MAAYDAFISYSHAKDKPIAAALQSVVQELGKPWYRRRALRVFRDDTSLSATPSLWPSIEQALSQSRFLILLASPEATASQWVGKEVSYWLEHKGPDTLLIAVTSGDLAWDNAAGDFGRHDETPLPAALVGRFASEPKWVDVRAYRDGANPRDMHFAELAADLAAAVHGMPKEDLLSEELRQQRRALTLAWSAAGSLLVLAGVAGWQWKVAIDNERAATGQKHIAEQQSAIAKSEAARAERNFGAAKNTIDSVIFDLAEGLRNIEGMRVQTVRRILDRAEAAVAQLAARTENVPAVQRSQAAMFNLFAETYLQLGATKLADDYAQKALAITRALVAKEPNNDQWQRDVAISLNNVGAVRWDQGDLAGALAAHRESLAILRALEAKQPGGYQRDMTVPLGMIGDVMAAQGDLSGALAAYREFLAISRALAAKTPDVLVLHRDVSVALNKTGDMLVAQGDRDGALAAFREGLDIRRRLAAKDPANTVWQRDLVVSLNKIGDTLAAKGERAGALVALREALAIMHALAVKDPGNVIWQGDVALGQEKIGDVLIAERDYAGALAAYRDGLAIRRALSAKDPGNKVWRREVSLSLGRVADVLLAQGSREEALAAYRETLDIRRALAAADPASAQWQTEVVQALVKLAVADDDPRGRITEALDILRRLDANGRLTPVQQKWIPALEAELAKLGQASVQ